MARKLFSLSWVPWVALLVSGMAQQVPQPASQDTHRNHAGQPANQVVQLVPQVVPRPLGSAQDLVRRAVENEDKANNDNSRFMYRLRTETPKGSITKELVETDDGVVGRLIAANDKPPNEEQRRQDDKKLEKLLNSPQERARKQKAQKEDEARVTRMVKALPDAFLYEYDETAPGNSGNGQLLRLRFKPNLKYDPPTRELQVYQGMQGTMLIDPRQERLVTIDAELFRGVNFGWGILGHLDKGGKFMVAQSNLSNGRWEVTEMRLSFTGKIFFFKSLNIQEHETASNYRRVPEHLSFAQGLELLRKQDRELAEKQP